MLEKQSNVIAAYPDGDTGVVVIHASKVDALDKPTVTKVIEGKKPFKVRKFSKKVVAKVMDDPAKNDKPAPKREG